MDNQQYSESVKTLEKIMRQMMHEGPIRTVEIAQMVSRVQLAALVALVGHVTGEGAPDVAKKFYEDYMKSFDKDFHLLFSTACENLGVDNPWDVNVQTRTEIMREVGLQ
jgi:hypothetical protein